MDSWFANGKYDGPSFKDTIAGTFVAFFLYYSWRALTSEKALNLVQVLIPPLSIILTGYFGQEALAYYYDRKDAKYGQGNKSLTSDPSEEV